MPDDIYSAIMGNAPTNEEQTQALVQALRGQKLIGQLGMLSGDPYVGKVGQQLDTSSDTQAQQIGQERLRQTAAANEKAFRDAQIENMQAERENAKSTLEETMRFHNMEHQEKMAALGISSDGTRDASFDKMVDDIGQLRAPPLNASNTRNPRNFNIMQAVYEKYPGYDGSQWQNKQSTVNKFTEGPEGRLLRSADAGIQHLHQIDQGIDDLKNTPVSFINAGVNWVKKEMGLSVAPTSFDAQKGIVAAEITKFIEGGGTGAGALADRQALEHDLDTAGNPAALHQVVAKWRGLMAGQLHALGNQYARGTYGTIGMEDDKHPFHYLNPETRSALGIPDTKEHGASGGWADDPRYKGMKVTRVDQPAATTPTPVQPGQDPNSATPDNPMGAKGRPPNPPGQPSDLMVAQ
jgi:hypothetical protein